MGIPYYLPNTVVYIFLLYCQVPKVYIVVKRLFVDKGYSFSFLTLMRMTKDEKGIAFFKGLLL